jgi:3-hydroxybutyrate dehydrogenase
MKLAGKTAVVTGAASGIGKSIAQTLAAEGAAVAIADLNPAGASAVAKEIQAAGGKALGIAMDVTSEEAVNAGIRQVADTWGTIDILVSNAGIQIVNPIQDYKSPIGRRCSRSILTARS